MSDKRTPNIVATAPERIYLVIGEDVNKSTDFADLGGEGITWCEDKIDGNSIEYVRADKNAEPIGYIYSDNGLKIGAINRNDVPNGTPLYTHPPESALQRLTEAGEIQAAMERIATLEAALHLAFAKMDRARDILTDGKPRTDCNWGMLATEAIKHGLGWPIDRAALAGKPAPRLTDDEVSALRSKFGWSKDTIRAIEAKVRGE